MDKIKLSEKNKTGLALGACVVFICLIGFLCFYKLGVKYVDPWDEARHGVNAYEMLHEANAFQNTYLYEADYYNLKPPLSMWCQMVSFWIMGASSFSLRFYSGVCYLLLAFVCAGFAWKRYGRLSAVLVLTLLAANTTPFAAHMVRAGDADSLYVLLFTLAMLFMIQIPQKQSNLYWCGLFFALAFLTKSYHAGIIAVIGGLYLILTGEIRKMKPKTWGIFIASCVVPIAIWAVPRFMVDGTAFFKEMLLTDVFGRTDGTLQNNMQPFGWYADYYLGTMSGKLTIYLWALIVVVMGIFLFGIGKSKDELLVYKNELIAFGLWILVPFLAFSAVSNKLLWYLYPVTIPLLLCMAIVIAYVLRDKRLLPIFRMAAAILALVCILNYTRDVFATIQNQTTVAGNDFQNLIKDTSEKLIAEYGEDATIYASVVYGVDENGEMDDTWAGQDVFVAEAYGNMLCKEGGISFVTSDRIKPQKADAKVIFVSKECELLLNESDEIPQEGFVNYGESEEYVVYLWH